MVRGQLEAIESQEEEGPSLMMAVYCDELNRRVLVDIPSLTGLTGDDGRLTVTYECICGRTGRMLTGRDRFGGGMSGHILV